LFERFRYQRSGTTRWVGAFAGLVTLTGTTHALAQPAPTTPQTQPPASTPGTAPEAAAPDAKPGAGAAPPPAPPAPPTPPPGDAPATPPAAPGEATTPPATATNPGDAPVPMVATPPPAPAPAEPPKAEETQPEAAASPPPVATLEVRDDLKEPGYLPGYRDNFAIGMAPYVPRLGALPGGVTPGFAAPMPSGDWSFRYAGFMTMTLLVGFNDRDQPLEGQSDTAAHMLPAIIEEYGQFNSVVSVPGNWFAGNFSYGNKYVTGTVSINTWNPTRPTNLYQTGSQYFINDMFLTFRVPPINDVRLGFQVGFFSLGYGGLGRYGGGLYTNTIAGGVAGAGELATLEYDLSEDVTLNVQHGFMGPKIGKVDDEVRIGNGTQGDPTYPGDFVHHAHVGILKKGDLQLQGQLHYFHDWFQDDRVQRSPEVYRGFADLPTPEVEEDASQDGSIDVIAADFKVSSRAYGNLGVGAAYISGENAALLRTLGTYGGDGVNLSERWWGDHAGGDGTMFVAGIDYQTSVATMMLDPEPFNGSAPDITINAGFHVATTSSSYAPSDGRVRYKGGVNVLYTFLPFLGAGVRVDRVSPDSKDPEEAFYVLAPRLQFKTDWTAREAITVGYVKWFFGKETDPGDKYDDQMFLLNFNMWW
jgi:hypothetical protein